MCETMGLPDACVEDVDKMEVVDAIMFHHLKELKEDMKVPKKLKEMSKKYLRKCQSYCEMSLAECRMGFRLDCYTQ